MSNVALGVIDAQNDFADPNGELYVKGGETILDPISKLLDAARKTKKTIFFSCDQHHNPDPEFRDWPPHCIAGTLGAQMIFRALEEDIVVAKGSFQYSAFAVSPTYDLQLSFLEDELSGRGIISLVLVGLAYDFCLGETALDAVNYFSNVYIVSDCTRAVALPGKDNEPDSETKMRKRLEHAGVKHISFDEAMKMLREKEEKE